MDRIRLAIVGCGNIAQLNARGYLQHPQCDVVALCDTVQTLAETRAQQWEISPTIYTDLDQVLNDAQIDAVERLTPTFTGRLERQKMFQVDLAIYQASQLERPVDPESVA